MKINYQLEAVFVRSMIEELDAIRRKGDASRDKVSAKINNVFNSPWGKGNKDLERGAIIGLMKTTETSMNEFYGQLAKIQRMLNSRVSELNACSSIEEAKRRSK